MTGTPTQALRPMALALMATGALPFVAAALIALGPALAPFGWTGAAVATAYGGVILSFLGGIRWGLGLAGGTPRDLALSVVPSLAGFTALMLPVAIGLPLLIVGFTGQLTWDMQASSPLPAWFRRLRMAITGIVIVSLVVVMLAGQSPAR